MKKYEVLVPIHQGPDEKRVRKMAEVGSVIDMNEADAASLVECGALREYTGAQQAAAGLPLDDPDFAEQVAKLAEGWKKAKDLPPDTAAGKPKDGTATAGKVASGKADGDKPADKTKSA
jgi:hypothetical protein